MEPLKVSSLLQQIKGLLEGQFRFVQVEGEVSNLSKAHSGHIYFSVSDSQASLSCALFKMDALRNPMVKNLKNGDKVILSGSLGVYAKRGTFQMIVKRLTPSGAGDLHAQLEMLKKKLAAEGLFDPQQKKTIPILPKRVGVITAPGGAALQDFLNIYERRSFQMDIVLIPALVQGDKAPESIRKALFKAIKYSLEAPEDKRLDALVLTRGGGSLEDLWAFNDEALAWDIFNCPIPIISAVGHQVDFSISDMVADLRCETPSAAAQELTEYQMSVQEKLQRIGRGLHNNGQKAIDFAHRRLDQLHPRVLLEEISGRLYQFQKRLQALNLTHRLEEFIGLYEKRMRLDDCFGRLGRHFPDQIKSYRQRLNHCEGLLSALNPENVLGRGYSFVKTKGGQVVANSLSFNNLSTQEELIIQFNDGEGHVKKIGN